MMIFGGLTAKDIARALELDDAIELDLRDPKDSIILGQIAWAREAAIEGVGEILSLIETKPHETAELIRLSGKVRHYTNLSAWLLKSREAGKEAWDRLNADQQQEVIDYTETLTHPLQGMNHA